MDLEQFNSTIGLVDPVPLDWIEIEQEHTYEDDGRVPHVPFGFNNAEWEKLKSKRTKTAELRSFCSSKESWDQCMGSAGYVLLDHGKVIASIVTRMN